MNGESKRKKEGKEEGEERGENMHMCTMCVCEQRSSVPSGSFR